MSEFADRSFDMVLATDGAISFCAEQAQNALAECCRLTQRTLVATVFHRAKLISQWVTASIKSTEKLLPAVQVMVEQGLWHQDQFTENAQLAKGCTNNYLGAFKAFLPDEVRTTVQNAGLQIERLGGLGSLAHLCGQQTVDHVLTDEALFEQFIELCDNFDRDIQPQGSGTYQRSGLIVVAHR